MRTLALVTLLLTSPCVAEPSARLLPREAPPAALDLSGNGKWVVAGIASGALLTAVATVLAIIVWSSMQSGLVFPTTVHVSNGPR
jgi:hypothetical protein